jgi:hypothetical protein
MVRGCFTSQMHSLSCLLVARARCSRPCEQTSVTIADCCIGVGPVLMRAGRGRGKGGCSGTPSCLTDNMVVWLLSK